MLEKISNITQNKEYKGKKRSSDFTKYFEKSFGKSEIGKDSIVFSPAAIYLTRIKWDMQDVEYKPGDKIALDFFVNDIEFKTEIDVGHIYKSNKMNFEILKRELAGHRILKTMGKLIVTVKEYEISDDISILKLAGIQELFENIKSLKLADKKRNNDLLSLQELLLGYQNDVYNEFDVLIKRIYTFIDKLNKYKLKDKHKFEMDNDPLVIIEEVASFYG